MSERLIDFVWMPDRTGAERDLKLHDLAQLRQCVAAGVRGIEDGDCISKASRSRLDAVGLVERRPGAWGIRTFATELGVRTARWNISYRDGSETPARKTA